MKPTDAQTQLCLMRVSHDISVSVAVDKGAHDEISLALARGSFALPLHYNLLLGALLPGDIVLDVGAHIGTFSLAAAAHSLRVVAIEASPRNAALLQRAADYQGFGDRLEVICAAVADRPGSVYFLEAGPYGHVVDSPEESGAVKVPAITVDHLLHDLRPGPIAAVKLDVEGSEPAALRGMAQLLTGPTAPLLLYEGNGHTLHLFDSTPSDLISALAGFGYTSYAVRPGSLRLARPESPQWDCVVDYLATKGFPPSLESLPLLDELPSEKNISEMEQFASHPNPHYRAHVARTIRRWVTAPPNQKGTLARVIEALRSDPDPTVRLAAS